MAASARAGVRIARVRTVCAARGDHGPLERDRPPRSTCVCGAAPDQRGSVVPGRASEIIIVCYVRPQLRTHGPHCPLSSPPVPPGASETRPHPARPSRGLASHRRSWRFKQPPRPKAAGLARKPCQLRRWRRRVIDVAAPTPQDGPAARPSAPSTSRSPPGNCRKLFAQGRAEAMAGERRAHEVVVRNR